MLIAIVNLLFSCTTTRYVSTVDNIQQELYKIDVNSKYVVINDKDTTWNLEDAILDSNNNVLYGTYNSLEQYRFMDKKMILDLHISEYNFHLDSITKIHVNSITKLETKEVLYDSKQTLIGFVVFVGVFGALITLAVSSLTIGP